MQEDIITQQLNQITEADMSNYDEVNNAYFIPQRKEIKLEEDKCYLIHLKPGIHLNKVVKENWNHNIDFPKYDYLKIDIAKKMVKMIKVIASGYDFVNKVDIPFFWNGWLSCEDIEVLEAI